jgi:FtsP/CotA-like multicopper oxidase with cupredoxin domain
MIITGAAAAATACLAAPLAGRAQTAPAKAEPLPPTGYIPVITPNNTTLEWKLIDGVKVGHLIAEPCKREFAPGLLVDCWGYNGVSPGPTIEAVEGDRLRIYVTNKLPAPTSVHWHGILLPNGMDGVSSLTQKAIPPGETYKYEFVLRQSGTHMYHSHFDEMVQQALGLMGMFIIHPKQPTGPTIDRDFAMLLSEWKVVPGTTRPDPSEMTDFNLLTINGKVFPGTAPLVVRTGQRVRLRFGNLGAMDHHPMHLHGYTFTNTEADGERLPETAQYKGNTVLVTVGASRAVEFIADAPGDWALHCHMSHHTMNQMGHGLPNLMGIDDAGLDRKMSPLLPGYMSMGTTGMGDMGEMSMPVPPNSISMGTTAGQFGKIDMGGMFTILKVRDDITSYDDPGWYKNPAGTVADVAAANELAKDGIKVD